MKERRNLCSISEEESHSHYHKQELEARRPRPLVTLSSSPQPPLGPLSHPTLPFTSILLSQLSAPCPSARNPTLTVSLGRFCMRHPHHETLHKINVDTFLLILKVLCQVHSQAHLAPTKNGVEFGPATVESNLQSSLRELVLHHEHSKFLPLLA